MKELIKEFNKYLIAEHGITLDCNYNKDEMYLICWFIKRSLRQRSAYISNFCNMDLIDYLLETVPLVPLLHLSSSSLGIVIIVSTSPVKNFSSTYFLLVG